MNFKYLATLLLSTALMLFAFVQTSLAEKSTEPDQQTVVSGTVVDARTGSTMAGVNVYVKGTVRGVATDMNGNFTLRINQEPPLTLVVSIIGYITREFEITDSETRDMRIEIREDTLLGSDIVVSASRFEQSILEAPVSVERMDIIAVNQTPAPSYYMGLANLKGVDMTTSSINFQIINARGFNSTGNTRMVQLTDGMDTQAPALNFPIGNLNGPSILDVESMEFLPGASSALYGPNAFNGILLVNSKNPFRYPGLSVHVQSGVNHLTGNENLGEPGSPSPMFETSVRYADRIGDRFAYKVNFSYSEADDWRGVDFSDKNRATQPDGFGHNPGYDGVHLYGDDGTLNIALLALNDGFVANLANAHFDGDQTAAQVYALQNLPNLPVARTGYEEQYLVDNDAKNMKASTSLHYRLTDNLEASYSFNYGSGTSVYTGAQRYSLKDFYIYQHKLELESENFLWRAYGTFENSGDSYIADFVGFSINDQYKATPQWFAEYGIGYLGYLLNSNSDDFESAHLTARNFADQGRIEPGTPEFDEAFDNAVSEVIPDGALFNDQSRFYHTESIYNFRDLVDFADIQLGLSYRQYQLRSNGTIFADGDGGIDINEFGGFLQASRAFLDDRLRLTGSVRYDKNENFSGQFNPRLSSVIRVADGQNIRASYQTGFRNPTTQGQYIDLNVLTARLLGGLPEIVEPYNVTENAYTMESVERFSNQFIQDPTSSDNVQSAIDMLVPYEEFSAVKPEQIQSFEVGYKGLLLNQRLYIDMAYYYNIYNDFIGQFRVRRAAAAFTGDISTDTPIAGSLLSGDAGNTFQLYTNVDETVRSHGAVFGFDYSLARGYQISANYNWNKLITEQEGGFVFDFNTPEHKFNASLSNRRIYENLGFNLTFRWQDEFQWTSSFADGVVPSVSSLDAQLTYRVPNLNSIVKVGGTNLTNNRHFLSYGGPYLGTMYYVSLTFDQFLN